MATSEWPLMKAKNRQDKGSGEIYEWPEAEINKYTLDTDWILKDSAVKRPRWVYMTRMPQQRTRCKRLWIEFRKNHGDKVHRILFRAETLLLSLRCQHRILDCILLIWKGGPGISSVNFSFLNRIKMNLIIFTGLSKHFSFFSLSLSLFLSFFFFFFFFFFFDEIKSQRKLFALCNRQDFRDGQYKCHHVSIHLVDIFMFPWL